MKTTVDLVNFHRTRRVRVPCSVAAIPDWPEVPAVVHRPVSWVEGQPAKVQRTGWKVSCAVCGLGFMNGAEGATRKEALAIARDNFAKVAARFSRARILKEYRKERAGVLAATAGLVPEVAA